MAGTGDDGLICPTCAGAGELRVGQPRYVFVQEEWGPRTSWEWTTVHCGICDGTGRISACVLCRTRPFKDTSRHYLCAECEARATAIAHELSRAVESRRYRGEDPELAPHDRRIPE